MSSWKTTTKTRRISCRTEVLSSIHGVCSLHYFLISGEVAIILGELRVMQSHQSSLGALFVFKTDKLHDYSGR